MEVLENIWELAHKDFQVLSATEDAKQIHKERHQKGYFLYLSFQTTDYYRFLPNTAVNRSSLLK